MNELFKRNSECIGNEIVINTYQNYKHKCRFRLIFITSIGKNMYCIGIRPASLYKSNWQIVITLSYGGPHYKTIFKEYGKLYTYYTTMSIIVPFYNEEKCLEIFTIIFLKTLK